MSIRAHLVPYAGDTPYLRLIQKKKNRILRSIGRNIRNKLKDSDELSDSSDDEGHDSKGLIESVIYIAMDHIDKVIYNFKSNEHINQFASKCGKVDYVMLYHVLDHTHKVEYPLLEAGIHEIDKTFRNRKGVGIVWTRGFNDEGLRKLEGVGINTNLTKYK